VKTNIQVRLIKACMLILAQTQFC